MIPRFYSCRPIKITKTSTLGQLYVQFSPRKTRDGQVGASCVFCHGSLRYSAGEHELLSCDSCDWHLLYKYMSLNNNMWQDRYLQSVTVKKNKVHVNQVPDYTTLADLLNRSWAKGAANKAKSNEPQIL